MAKTKISEFSTTAGNNTDINSINIAEGCAPSGINDAIRELMRQLKEFQTGGAGDSVNSGGDFSVATNKFTVASASGNTSVAGTLGVTGTTTLTGALVANGNATLGDASGDTVTIKGTPTLEVNPTLSGGTANGVLYLNGSKVATSGSALTFDGTTLGNSGGFLTLARPSGIGNTQITLTNNGAGASGFQLGQSAQQQQFFIYDTGAAKDRYIINSSGEHAWYGASEAMRLTSTGLGIGTSSPGYKLDVAGDMRGNSWIGRTNISAPTADAAMYRAADNTIAFSTANTERARIDSSGNLGLGVTPSAWSPSGAGGPILQIQNGAFFGSTSTTGVLNNAYYNGGFKYISNDYASWYEQIDSKHAWYTAPSGTAGDAITFTQAMTLDASGNLALGRTSASFRADVEGDFRFGNFVSGGTLNGYFGCANTGSITLNFGGTTTPTKGRILYSDNSDLFAFYTNSTERARIDSSGNFIHQVNGTAPTLSTNSTMSFELTSNTSLKIVVRGSDGTTRSATLTLA